MAEEINVEIANLATGFFGEDDQISSPDDNSKPARSVRAVWALVREFVLSKADWSFARRFSNLTARPDNQAEFPLIGYAKAYPLPTKFIRLVRIVDPANLDASLIDYRIMRGPSGREIWCDYDSPLTIEWIEDVKDPALWSSEFTECFAMRLAWQVADRLSGDKQRKEQALGAYKETLSSGRNSDARQQPPRKHEASDWVKARMRGADLRAPNT